MQTGIEVTHVPYKSMVQPLNDVLGGHLNYMFSDLRPRCRCLRRQAPCARRDVGHTRGDGERDPDARGGRCAGLRGGGLVDDRDARRSPLDIINRLHGEMKTILAQPEVREQIARFGMIPQDSASPEELHRYVASETLRWGKIVQQAGATGIE